MWHSSRGNRTLHGNEAVLVASAIDTMIDALMVHVDEDDLVDQVIPDCESGIPIYDRLNACQRIGLLNQLTVYLLTETARPLKLSALADAGVAAIFVEVRDQVAIEIDLCEELTADDTHVWRRLVLEAAHEVIDEDDRINDFPPSSCTTLSRWEDLVDVLAGAVLWDRDFELVDMFLDADPGISGRRRRLLGIERDYFTDVAPDPRPDEACGLIRQTRDIIRSRPR